MSYHVTSNRSLFRSILVGIILGLVATPDIVLANQLKPQGTQRFSEVAGLSGIGPYTNAVGMTAGAAVADFDADGKLDIFVPNGHGVADQLYHNLGNGQFVDIAGAKNLDSLVNNRGALWFDYDDDGDLDLLVLADDYLKESDFVPSNLTLYRQDPSGNFTDVTVAAGLFGALNDPIANSENHLGGAAVADLDNDGYLELLVGFWRGEAFLYQNNAGVFAPSSVIPLGPGDYWQPVFADFDDDGYQDLFMAVDFNKNLFFHNQGGTQFIEMGQALGMQNDEQNDMGAAVGDVDNDGDLDLFVSNIYSGETRRNHLYVNESMPGNPDFTERAVQAGVADSGWGWGATFTDYDGDSRLDLAVTNGFFGEVDATKLFKNNGGMPSSFTDVAGIEGFDDTEWGACLLSFDYDADGDVDFLQTTVNGPLRLMANEGAASGNYLKVRPRMRSGNRFAIGALVTTEFDSKILSRLITAGTSLMCQEPAEALFGLGSTTEINKLTIKWPEGHVTVLTKIGANRVIDINDDLIFINAFN